MIASFWKRFRLRKLARRDAEIDRKSSGGTAALEHTVDYFLREYENHRSSLISTWKTKRMLPVYRKLKTKHEIIMKAQEELKQHPTTMERLWCENEIRRNETDRQSLESLYKKINNYESEELSLWEINERLKQNSEEQKALLSEHKRLLDREKKEKEPLNQKFASACMKWAKLDNKWQRRESYFDNKLEGLRVKYTKGYDYYRQCYTTHRPRRLETNSFGERCKLLGIDTGNAKTVLSEENDSIKTWRKDVSSILNQ